MKIRIFRHNLVAPPPKVHKGLRTIDFAFSSLGDVLNDRLHYLQILRAFGALFVLLAHIGGLEVRTHEAANTSGVIIDSVFLKNLGVASVQMFFVLSGFIMSVVSARAKPSVANSANYLLGRFFRVMPVWWLFLLLYCGALFINFGVPWNPLFLRADVSGWDALIKSFFLIPYEQIPILPVGWSLVHEQYFYIAFAFILLVPFRFHLIALALWALVPISSLLMGVRLFDAHTIIDLIVHPLTFEYIAGAALGWLFAKNVRPVPGLVFAAGVISFLAVSALSPIPFMGSPIIYRVSLILLPCALLVYGAAGLAMSERFSGIIKLLSRFGDYSYSLYLCHPIVILIAPKIMTTTANLGEAVLNLTPGQLDFLRLGSAGYFDNIIYIVGVFIGANVISAMAYHWFETPIIRWYKSRSKRRPEKKSTLAAE